jgi:16S rRNA (guanine527-N7)-methyltransferase
MEKLIAQGLTQMGLRPDAAPQLAEYGRLLLEKNQVMNLTAITEPEKVAQLHMLDSAALLTGVDFRGKTLLDVGTGAGFPGLPLRLVEPSIRLTLLDSLAKRVNWLAEVSARLGAEDVVCIHARAEEQALKPGWRDSFDLVTSRAVADLSMLCELCLPYVKVGGLFLAMKSTDCDDELSRAARGIARLGGQLKPGFDYTIPGSDITHRVVVIEKETPTPKGYPRRFAKIQKSPL